MFDDALQAIGFYDPMVFLALAVSVYFMAGVIKGTLGIGFPTAAVSMMAQFTDARSAITLVILPMLVTNIWQVIRSKRFLSVIRQVWILVCLMLIFIAIFSQLASRVRVDVLAALLGVVVSVYALHSLYAKPLQLNTKHDKPAQALTGALAGAMGGLVAVWAPPILIYLSAKRLPKEEFVATAGVMLLLGTVVLFLSYLGNGTLSEGFFLYSMLLVLPALAGFGVGEQIRRRLSAQRFQRLLLWFFFIMGLNLIRRSVF